ncbi:hypothetical protein CDL15_Pgr028947 [Punica granatum]|uniref:Uncharacterized protein n=1 Tax=Punica granatum TaxID=22663 RepID=A0A218WY57_PUNGR|nr:hypothetical protein CDL15_Pgr028947 [Punica granatum]PKI52040.1 hypothetical protein CRG98_027572 [Punica granatum]
MDEFDVPKDELDVIRDEFDVTRDEFDVTRDELDETMDEFDVIRDEFDVTMDEFDVAVARNKDANPNINLLGSAWRKSFSAYHAVRIDKNIEMAVAEEKRASTSTANHVNTCSVRNRGLPLPSTFPPGTVKAAANTTVAVRADTTMQEFDVSFIHFSASLSKSWCSFANSSRAARPSLSFCTLTGG